MRLLCVFYLMAVGFVYGGDDEPQEVPKLFSLAGQTYLRHVERSLTWHPGQKPIEYDAAVKKLHYDLCFRLTDDLCYTTAFHVLFLTRACKSTAMEGLCAGLRDRARAAKHQSLRDNFEWLRIHVAFFAVPLIRDRRVAFAAVYANKADIIKTLFSMGVNPNMCLGLDSLLLCAVKHQRYQIVQDLLEHGADPNSVHSTKPLYHAAFNNDEKMSQLLIICGASCDYPYRQGCNETIRDRIQRLFASAREYCDRERYFKALQLILYKPDEKS